MRLKLRLLFSLPIHERKQWPVFQLPVFSQPFKSSDIDPEIQLPVFLHPFTCCNISASSFIYIAASFIACCTIYSTVPPSHFSSPKNCLHKFQFISSPILTPSYPQNFQNSSPLPKHRYPFTIPSVFQGRVRKQSPDDSPSLSLLQELDMLDRDPTVVCFRPWPKTGSVPMNMSSTSNDVLNLVPI